MILTQYYLDDLKEHLENTPPDVFAKKNTSLTEILANKDLLNALWANYQKCIEDYNLTPEEAYEDTLETCFG